MTDGEAKHAAPVESTYEMPQPGATSSEGTMPPTGPPTGATPILYGAHTGSPPAHERQRSLEQYPARKLVDLWDRLQFEQPLQFDALVQAHAAAVGLYPHLGDVAAEADELRHALRGAFTQQHGNVVALYLCSRRVVGGATLTEGPVPGERGRVRRTLHAALSTSDGALLDLEHRAVTLARDAVRVFADRPAWLPAMRQATDEVYAAMSQVLNAAESPDGTERAAAVSAAQRQIESTSERVRQLIQRQSRFSYLGGVLGGAVLATVLCVLLALADRAWWSAQVAPGPFLAAGIFGALGAVASVFGRIAGEGLIIDYTAGLWQKRLLGALRSVIGSVLGIAAHFVLVGGVLGGQLADDNARAAFAFFALVGFAAGFTERFATDLIERAGKVIAGKA